MGHFVGEKSIIIIGAGLGGLSAGCYGQINGYKTSFEMYDKIGGLRIVATQGQNLCYR